MSASTAHREDEITIAGCRSFVLRGGEGPPLLFLHGGGGGGVWQPWMARLARRFEVIAPELPGFGRADLPDWLENIHDAAYFVLELMAALGLRDTLLLGHSLGGWVAAEAAVRSTERLSGLALVAPAGIHVPGVARPDLFLMTPEEMARARFHDQRLVEAELALPPPDEATLDRQLRNRFTLARLMWAPRGFDPHLGKWLHRIRLPSLVVWGKQDALLPVAYAEAWAGLLPQARLRLLDACGHLPQIEQEAAFCDAFEGFAEGIGR